MSIEFRGEQLVYGDFSYLLNLKVSGDMQQISEIYRELRNLDKSLYIGFITYILARAGYCNKTICEKWRINSEIYEMPHDCSVCPLNPKLVQGENVDWSMWIQCSFAWAEELNELWDKYGEPVETVIWDMLGLMRKWSHYFENQITKHRVKVIFANELPEESKNIDDVKDWQTLSAIDPSCSNYVLVDPRAYKKARLEKLHDFLLNENISLVSVDEFADTFIPRGKKEHEFKNWLAIRNDTLDYLLKNNAILVIALEWQKFKDVEVHLKTARREYENANTRPDYENAIRNATYACESLLGIMYHKNYGKQAPSDFMWDKLMNSLKETIETEFGELVNSDLKFLQTWRNNVSHPQNKIPVLNKNITFQVINRSEAFYESVKATLNQFELPNG